MLTPEQNQLIIDSSDNGVIVYKCVRDKENRITDFECIYANNMAQLITGAPMEQLKVHTLRKQMPESSLWILDAYIHVVESGETFKQEFPFYRQSIGPVYFRVVTNKLDDGVVCIFNDTTEQRRIHEDLTANEKKYRGIFENVQDVFYQTDTKGIIMEISPSIRFYSEYNREEIIGRPVTDFYYFTEDREKLATELFTKGIISDFEVRLKTKDDRLVYTSVNCRVVKDDQGNVIGTEGSMRDISDRKAKEELLKEREQRLKLFISQAPTAIAMLDTKLQYLVVSQRWCDDFRFITDDFIGKPHDVLFSEAGFSKGDVYRKCLEGGSEQKSEDKIILKDGTVHWFKWDIRSWFDINGDVGGILIFTEDISEQKSQQDKIHELFRELQEINRQKDKLFSIIAHDLRGPLGTFSSLFEMLVEDYDSFSREELMECFNQIKASSSNVYQLLEDLLLWARNQLDKVSFEPKMFNLSQLVTKVFTYLEPQSVVKVIRLESNITADAAVFADVNMVETVIRNLISNAIKFSNRGGKVTLSMERQGDFTEVSVTDEGIGIKAEDLAKLFDKSSAFTTYGTQGEKGTGIGLDLCSDFVEKNGGCIKVQSEAGKGSTFSFTLKSRG